MSVVADWRGPSQKLRVCRADEVIIGEAAAAAAAVVGQQAGGRDDAQRGIGSQTVSVHGVPVAVFEGEGAGVESQRVELQRAGGGAGLEGRLDR